jgi:hypothetical protein
MDDDVDYTYSEITGAYYESYEDLVAAESNGYAVVGVSERPRTVPVVVGPFPDKKEAAKAVQRLRRGWSKHERPHKVHIYVRILWKEHREVRT